jgi:peptide/nickel transport system ATP-binding protein
MTRLLVVQDLTVRFPGPEGARPAVDGVSFEVGDGETLGIVGESGSGKSMLCRAVLGLMPPTGDVIGSVLFDGTRLNLLPERRMRALRGSQLALVLQNPMTSLNPVVRVGRLLTETLRRHERLGRAAARRRAVDLLARVGIPDPGWRMSSYPHELSGGMRQRVSIAIALACRPRLLFADEPTTALDPTVQRRILDLLGAVQRADGMSLVLVSHDLGVVAGRTDRVMVMYGGRVVETGPTRQVFRAPRHPYTAAVLAATPRLHGPSAAPLAEIPTAADGPATACRFAPRCERARPRCLRDVPALMAAGDGARTAACFYPLGADALATTTDGRSE